jgi:hypothetical protein
MSETPIYKAVEELPTSGLTVRTLQMLDFVVPGQWKNLTSFEQIIKDETGETDEEYIQQIGERAIELYNDTTQNYQKAMKVFRLVDDIDKVAGAAALASQAAERFSFLSFLDKITPKDEKTQALDAALKLIAEVSCFCLINGIPGDSVADFVKAVANYEKEDAMRFAAWVTIDGVLPLGPNFMDLIADKLQQTNEQELSSNSFFSKISGYLPGGSLLDKKNFIIETIVKLKATVSNFIASKGITQDAIAGKLKGFVEISDKRMDLLAAALDMSTNYFEHTGTQTITRQLVRRAYGEV